MPDVLVLIFDKQWGIKLMAGRSSATGNNCIFHCFTHVLFSEHGPKEIASTPGFQSLCEAVKDYYGLDSFNKSDLEKLNQTFSHPLERELIWGPVFRQLLIERLKKQDAEANAELIASLEKGDSVYLEDFVGLAESFNAEVHSRNEYDDAGEKFNENEDATWRFFVAHKKAGSGHYEFYYETNEPESEDLNPHNEKMGLPNPDTQWHDYANTHFVQVSSIVGTMQRAAAIKRIVKAGLEATDQPALARSRDALSDERSPSGLSFATEVEIDPEDDKEVVFEVFDKPRGTASPSVSDPTSMSISDSQSSSASKSMEEKQAPDQVKFFNVELKEALEKAFTEDDGYTINFDKFDEGFVTIESENGSVQIEKTAEGTRFRGSSDNLDDIVAAYKAYEESTEASSVEYELSSSDDETAMAFATKLHEQGLDLKEIVLITIDGKPLQEEERRAFLKKIDPTIEFEEKQEKRTSLGMSSKR